MCFAYWNIPLNCVQTPWICAYKFTKLQNLRVALILRFIESFNLADLYLRDLTDVRIKYFIRQFSGERDYVYSKTIGKTGLLYVYVVKSYINRTSDFTTYWN